MKLIDLTAPFGPQTTPVPGHPRITFDPIHTHERDGRSNTLCTFSIHTGTHIDAPFHFYREGATIDRLALETFMGPALRLDVRTSAKPGERLAFDALQRSGLPAVRELAGLRLVLWSGWAAARWNTDDLYANNPYLDEEAAKTLAASGIAALGLDFAADRAEPYPNHLTLLGAGIPLLENLVNLDQIPSPRFTLIAFPLPVTGGNGSPARAVALIT